MDLSWDHWRSFLAVVDEGSLSGAARVLGLTQPTLGRHIAQMETALATGLFLRSPSGLIATDVALSLVPQARAMAAAAATLRRTASGGQGADTGTVRLAASEVVGAEILPPFLAAFAEDHPAIAVELVLSNRNEDLLRHDADIAVRMQRPTQTALLARRLGPVPLSLYAHNRYAARRGLPDRLESLTEHALIGPESLRGLAGLTLGDRPVTPALFTYRSDSDLAQLALLRAGLGIGICQELIAARDPALLPVLPGQVRFTLDAWLLMHEDLRASRRVRLLHNVLAQGLGQIWR
ncbi:MAG: LysR family transcriptional regulator [Rhodobacter sp.]|jgi:DNA-binding transcriptional LysR family regulator|nr:LysR family transcriptional regulator [Rhodobacter sp.]